MKKLLLASVLFLSACTGIKTPSLNMTPIDTANINKIGDACSYYLLGFIGPFGDNSLYNAARNGRISKVLYYDSSVEHYIVVARQCNRAYGY